MTYVQKRQIELLGNHRLNHLRCKKSKNGRLDPADLKTSMKNALLRAKNEKWIELIESTALDLIYYFDELARKTFGEEREYYQGQRDAICKLKTKVPYKVRKVLKVNSLLPSILTLFFIYFQFNPPNNRFGGS